MCLETWQISLQSNRSFFKTLVEHEITVELKNEVQIRGTLKSVDQYLNIKLDNAEAVDEMRWPHLVRHEDAPRHIHHASERQYRESIS
jgi:small nuclear ribonucleoprotein (snRNP)-like protein